MKKILLDGELITEEEYLARIEFSKTIGNSFDRLLELSNQLEEFVETDPEFRKKVIARYKNNFDLPRPPYSWWSEDIEE